MNKGFTLVELLIVIAILGVLSASVVLVLNPAELLRQARDSTRVSDMATLNSAMSLYLTDVTTPDLNAANANADCDSKQYVIQDPTASSFTPARSGLGAYIKPTLVADNQKVNGLGWLPVNFEGIPGTGSPIGSLPLDPSNTGDNIYRYACDMTGTNTRYEINTKFESNKYTVTLKLDAKDGGDQAGFYEIGNSPGLVL